MHSLRDEPSPYSVLLAIIVVVIMASPNVAFLMIDAAIQPGDMPQRDLSEAELVFGLIISLILQLIVFLVALVPLLIRRRLDRRIFGPTQPTGSWQALGFGLVAGLASLFAAYTINILLGLIFGVDEAVEQELLQSALEGGFSLIIAGLIAIVMAPIVEEVVFRGVLFRALQDRLGVWTAAIVSSAIFAVIHVEVLLSQPVALGGLFAVGMVLAIAYHWTGNLLVPILGHAVFNASSLGLALAIDQLT